MRNLINRKLLCWDREIYISSKVTKMGSIIGHGIDYHGERRSERPAAHTLPKLTQVTPPPPLPGMESTRADRTVDG